MSSIFDSLDDTVDSLRGVYNISRVRAEDDPEKRRALEDKFIKERREREKSKGMFGGMEDAVRGRDASEGLDAREGVDPKDALDRRMREAGLEEEVPTAAVELKQRQQSAREIIAKRQAGEPVSDDEKRLVFEVVFDAMKGLSGLREKKLDEMEAKLQGQTGQV